MEIINVPRGKGFKPLYSYKIAQTTSALDRLKECKTYFSKDGKIKP